MQIATVSSWCNVAKRVNARAEGTTIPISASGRRLVTRPQVHLSVGQQVHQVGNEMELTSTSKDTGNPITAIKRSNSFPVSRDNISRAIDSVDAASSNSKERPSKRGRRLSETFCRSSRIYQIMEENKAESAQKREMEHQRKLNEIMKLSKSYDDLVEVNSGECLKNSPHSSEQHQLLPSISSASSSSLSASSFSSPSISPVCSSGSTSTSSPSAYFLSPRSSNRRQIHCSQNKSSHITMTPSALSSIKRKLDISHETIYCKREKLSSRLHSPSSVSSDMSAIKTCDFVVNRCDSDQVHM